MQTYEIQLQGQLLKIQTEHNQETLEIFKSKVEETLQNIVKNHQSISLDKSLLLACLCLAEDYHFLKQNVHQNLDRLESQVKNVFQSLEASSKELSFQVEKTL